MKSSALLVVDVQPAYRDWSETVVDGVVKRINNTRKPVIVMWVGEGLTDDTEADVFNYLHYNGARPGKLSQCRFIEKDYGFFRGWMDNGVSSSTIVKVGKEMLNTRRHSSEDLDLEAVLEADFEEVAGLASSIATPSFDSRLLSSFNNFDTCGGGGQECLAEIELYLSMLNKPYTRLDELVY
ncbi:uncharacterized protein NMK_2173 [Novimethylophilus kurashikiensis]|uniref:Uncharacterized protein n=1 Tax=Novimethylophilus kurashikiensis TaxID=1825523 RepID=A0A2R5FDA1_9PROT|nr:hypothetical protein [Novimethylophilus kurashikiensis]GBG14574.1 uncharacterized protein NMK_2173 [Novimethylophilus kurashikiensis]